MSNHKKHKQSRPTAARPSSSQAVTEKSPNAVKETVFRMGRFLAAQPRRVRRAFENNQNTVWATLKTIGIATIGWLTAMTIAALFGWQMVVVIMVLIGLSKLFEAYFTEAVTRAFVSTAAGA